MPAPRCEALDWMKAVGISLIVFGHVAHAAAAGWVPPIYVKQFGVSFFVFAAGVTLAREHRAPLVALWVRLFPVFLYGLGAALLMTAIGVAAGSGAAPSNFLPFLAGGNVLFDNFPANPTTWYVGLYVHVLLLWAFCLSGRTLAWPAVALALAIEVPMRAALIHWAGSYVAYMFVSSWLAVFVAGLVVGGRAPAPSRGGALPLFVALAIGMAAAGTAIGAANPQPEFPFMTFGPGILDAIRVSALVSAWHLPVTLIAFRAFSRMPLPGVVAWLARGSLVIMLLHMPIFFGLNPVLAGLGWPYAARAAAGLLISLALLGWLSATLTAVVQPKRLAQRGAARLAPMLAAWPPVRRTPSLETRW